MSPASGIVSDVFGQLGKTAKKTGRQAAKMSGDLFETGARQIKGGGGNGDKGQDLGTEKMTSKTGRADLSGQQDNLKAKQELELKEKQDREKSMARYKQIMDELQKYRQKKAQETPEYLAGKAGTPRTKKEEIELWQKQEKEEKEKKKQAVIKLPGQQGAIRGAGERLRGITG